MPENDMQSFALHGVANAVRWGKNLTDNSEVITQLKQAITELEALTLTDEIVKG